MQKKIKQLLKNWMPPALLQIAKRQQRGMWQGDYHSWAAAEKASTGYDHKIILEKVMNAQLKIKNNEAVYERDSVIFDKIQYSWPLLSALMWIAAQSNGNLNIIDFGGALGSTYSQNSKFLNHLPFVRWNIIEQNRFVDTGIKYFKSDNLKFYYDLQSCLKESNPNAILFSGVIQYLEKPYELIEEVLSFGFKFVVFDRTPFVFEEKDRLTVQTVFPEIYKASYPCWFFARTKFYSLFSERYTLIESFEALDNANIPSIFEGCIFKKNRV